MLLRSLSCDRRYEFDTSVDLTLRNTDTRLDPAFYIIMYSVYASDNSDLLTFCCTIADKYLTCSFALGRERIPLLGRAAARSVGASAAARLRLAARSRVRFNRRPAARARTAGRRWRAT